MIRNLERLLLFLFFFFLPSQLSYHAWPSWSLVHGIRVDYLSLTLYFTDLIILAVFFLSRFRVRVPLVVIIFAILNILISKSPNIAIYSWLRLLEYFWLFKYLSSRFHNSLFIILYSLSFAVIWTSLLAWSQFLKQASLGGWFYWLGERAFNIGTPGIAKISIAGHLLLRPYATLPHPNALAGFLLATALILFCHPEHSRGIPWASKVAIFLAALTIPITFSRTAIVLEVVILGCFLISKIKSATFKFLFVLMTFVFCLLNFTYGNPESLRDRQILNHKAILAIKQNWLSGVGLGNFIPATANYQLTTNDYQLVTQPVHNIYLLLASELGLPAFFVICYLLIKNSIRITNFKLKIAVLVVLITGLVDHYWLTLHQNSFILVVLFSLIISQLDAKR